MIDLKFSDTYQTEASKFQRYASFFIWKKYLFILCKIWFLCSFQVNVTNINNDISLNVIRLWKQLKSIGKQFGPVVQGNDVYNSKYFSEHPLNPYKRFRINWTHIYECVLIPKKKKARIDDTPVGAADNLVFTK